MLCSCCARDRDSMLRVGIRVLDSASFAARHTGAEGSREQAKHLQSSTKFILRSQTFLQR